MTGLAHRVAQNAPVLLAYLDPQLRILFASGHCSQLFGYQPDEIVGMLLAELVDPGTLKYARAHVAELEHGNSTPRDYVMRHRDGVPRHCQVHAIADRKAGGRSRGYFACASGLAPRRAARDFVSDAEHELRTPLSSIIAALELLGEGNPAALAEQPAFLVGMALENARRLARRVERVLEVERIELGTVSLEKTAIDLRELLAAALDRLRANATQRGVRIAPLLGDHDAWVRGDRARLEQAVGYLLGDAIANAPPGGEIGARVSADARTAEFEIRDQSAGATARRTAPPLTGRNPAELLPVDITLGSSLGLFISKAVVHRMGGTLGCAGHPRRGACFRVTLPRVPAPV
jgi:PAS domain S-box-containing protein